MRAYVQGRNVMKGKNGARHFMPFSVPVGPWPLEAQHVYTWKPKEWVISEWNIIFFYLTVLAALLPSLAATITSRASALFISYEHPQQKHLQLK